MKKGRLPAAAVTMMALLLIPSLACAFSLIRGQPTPLSSPDYTLSVNSVFDQVTLQEALVAPGIIGTGLGIPVNRIQYDILNNVVDTIISWTLYYDRSVGPLIVGAAVPTGYITSSGTKQYIGGQNYATLFNNGYGQYAYNTGAPWTIDYQPNRIVFTGPVGAAALPKDSATGETDVGYYLPTFSILWHRNVPVGYNAAIARADAQGEPFAGVVWGPSNQICVSEPGGALALVCAVPAIWGLVSRRRKV